MNPSPSTPATEQKPLLQQAPVVPLDASGLTASVIGFTLFFFGTLLTYALNPHGSWFPIFATGTLIGAVLMIITAGHRFRRTRMENRSQESVTTQSSL
ncbi:MAG: hypothetical protein FWG15_05280 [Propionibacteriaceae bacterium]|nr:hypothetical protein [Propionibacteriaceae bacterium]